MELIFGAHRQNHYSWLNTEFLADIFDYIKKISANFVHFVYKT